MENGVYTSLDIGTTSIKIVVTEVIDGQLNIIGVGSEESKGLKRGMIVNIDETVHAIKNAVKQAEEKAGISINSLIVGVSANDVSIEPCHGVISMQEDNQEIGDSEVYQVVEQAIANIIPPERDLLSVMLEEFIVDGFDEINDPRGMVGKRVEMYGTALSVPKTILHNIKKCVESSGYAIQSLVLQPQAMAQLALTEDERNFGIVQIDMGGGQTTVSAIHDEQVKFASVIQEGGSFVSKDISIVLNTSKKNADRLKREVGAVGGDEGRSVQVDIVGQSEPVRVEESYIGEIIEARLSQIFEQIKEQLDEIQALDLPGGIVITGGNSSIPGIQRLAEEIFEVRVQNYIPDMMGVRSPAFTVAIGLVKYESNLNDIQRLINQSILNEMGIQSVEPQSIRQERRSPSPSPSYNDHADTSEEVYEEESEPRPSFGDRIKDFFNNFFE